MTDERCPDDASDRMKRFQERRIADREDILEAAKKLREFWMGIPRGFTEQYCLHAADLTVEFILITGQKRIFPAPEGAWTYSILMRGSGIYLELLHYPEGSEETGTDPQQDQTEETVTSQEKINGMQVSPMYQDKTDERYLLYGAKAKLMAAEQYARMNDLEHVAVVTRIRRGKIRSAVKVGKQWRIPELAAPIERGYQSAAYSWYGKLSGMPVAYRVIEDYQRVDIFQDAIQHALFHIRMTKEDGTGVEFTCDRRQRDKIEQALIAHPDVQCLSDEIIRISFKDQECRVRKG